MASAMGTGAISVYIEGFSSCSMVVIVGVSDRPARFRATLSLISINSIITSYQIIDGIERKRRTDN